MVKSDSSLVNIEANGEKSKIDTGNINVNNIETHIENIYVCIDNECKANHGNNTQFGQILQGIEELKRKMDDKETSKDNKSCSSKKQDDSRIEYIVENNILDKKALLEFKATRGNLLNIFFDVAKIDENGIVDAGFVSVMNALLCCEKFNSKKYDDLKNFIINKHKDNVKGIIGERLDVIKHYFEGKDVVLELNEILKKNEDDSSVPKWLVNDVAMDLKNMTSILERNNYGLKFLSESKEFVYYPIGDKLASNIRDKIVKMYRMLFQENPTTHTISLIGDLFDDIASYFCIAFLYGSLTHILIFKSILQELFYALYLNETDNLMCLNAFIKLCILSHDGKQIDSFNRRSYSSILSSVDFKDIYNSILFLPFEQEKNMSKLILLGYYGYYLEDDIFKELSTWFYDFSSRTILDNSVFLKYNSYIEKAIEKCFVRLDNNSVANIVLSSLESPNYLVRRFSWKIFRYFRLNKLDYDMQNKFKNVILSQFDHINKGDYEMYYGYVVIPFCKNINIEYNEVEEKIKHLNQKYYENYFKLELKKNNYEYYIKQIDIYIDEIKNRIKICRNDISYGFAVNPFLMIRDIIYYSHIKLSKKKNRELLLVLKDFIIVPSVTISEKCDCILLLSVLLNLTRVTNNDKRIILSSLLSTKENLKKYQTPFFENTSYCSLDFYYEILMYFLNDKKKTKLDLILNKMFDMKDYDKIVCLKLLCDLTKNHVKFEFFDKLSIIQLASVLSRDEERDISYLAVKVMCNIYGKDTSNYILEHFNTIHKFVNQYSKELIAYTLNNSMIKDFRKNEILNDYLRDDNYYVKTILNK